MPRGDLDQLPDVGRFTALRNLLYAIEWWFFGAFAAVHLVALGAGTTPTAGRRGRRGLPTPGSVGWCA